MDDFDLENIEAIFLVGRHEEVLLHCQNRLNDIKPYVNPLGKESNIVLHESIPIMTLLIQSLFELKRTREVMDCVINFYGSSECIPFDITLLCLNMKVTLQEYKESEKMIKSICNRYIPKNNHTNTNQLNVSSSTISALPTTQEQYEILIELLVLNIYIPCKKYDKSLKFLARNTNYLSIDKIKALRNSVLEEQEKERKKTLECQNVDKVETSPTKPFTNGESHSETKKKIQPRPPISIWKQIHSHLWIMSFVAIISFFSIFLYSKRHKLKIVQFIKKKILLPISKLMATDPVNTTERMQRRR